MSIIIDVLWEMVERVIRGICTGFHTLRNHRLVKEKSGK
jgi:hypothetical protein